MSVRYRLARLVRQRLESVEKDVKQLSETIKRSESARPASNDLCLNMMHAKMMITEILACFAASKEDENE